MSACLVFLWPHVGGPTPKHIRAQMSEAVREPSDLAPDFQHGDPRRLSSLISLLCIPQMTSFVSTDDGGFLEMYFK